MDELGTTKRLSLDLEPRVWEGWHAQVMQPHIDGMVSSWILPLAPNAGFHLNRHTRAYSVIRASYGMAGGVKHLLFTI